MQEAERQAAAERAEQLEQERRKAEEATRVAEIERVALNKERQMLVVRAEGSAVIAKAGPGLTTSGRVKVPATIEVSAVASNVLSGEVGPVVAGAANLADAEVTSTKTVSFFTLPVLCFSQCNAVCSHTRMRWFGVLQLLSWCFSPVFRVYAFCRISASQLLER